MKINNKSIRTIKKIGIAFLLFCSMTFCIPRIFSAPNSFAAEMYGLMIVIVCFQGVSYWRKIK